MRVHACRHCGEVFPSYSDLRQHLDSHVSGHKCATCGRAFTRRDHLQRHASRCRPKPFTCDVCHSGFTRKWDLDQHKRTVQCGGPPQPGPAPKRRRIVASLNEDPVLAVPVEHAANDELSSAIRDFVHENWGSVRTHVVHGPIQTRYNRRLTSLDMRDLHDQLFLLFDQQTTAFKVNVSFGFVLREKENDRLRYYHSSNNCCGRYLEEPALITNRDDFDRFLARIQESDILQWAVAQRPNSDWVCELVTNATFFLNKIVDHPIGCVGVNLPTYVKNNKSIIGLETDSHGVIYIDNLCLFRCLGLHLGREAAALYAEYTDTSVHDFAGVTLDDLHKVESKFETNVVVYQLVEIDNGKTMAELVRRSPAQYQETMYVNLHESHYSYIQDIGKYCHSYRCRKCGDSLWKRPWELHRHESTCEAGVRHVYNGGVYHPPPSVFERLDDEGIIVSPVLRYFPYRATFDFECYFSDERLPVNSDKLQWSARHVPLSVSVASNVPGYEPALCFVTDGDADKLVGCMITRLNTISDAAYESLLPLYADVLEELKTRKEAWDEEEEEEDGKKTVNPCKTLEKQLQTWLRQLPVIGFNSGHYDLNVVKKFFIPYMLKGNDKTRFVIKRQNTFMCFSTTNLKFLDVTQYLAPGVSYDKYLKAYGCMQQKGHFPYEYMDNLRKLDDCVLPPQATFYSRLKNEGISDEDYARCQAVWYDNKMETLRDYLIFYNNLDVTPFLEAISKQFTRDDIGPYMRQYAEEHDIMSTPRRMLVGSYRGEKILLTTPLLQWYLAHGLVVDRVYQVVSYEPNPCFQRFGESVSAARRAGDADTDRAIIGDTMKLLGNSAYGKTVTNVDRHHDVKYCTEVGTSRLISNKRFRQLDVVTDDAYEVTSSKACLTYDLPLHIGFFVYQYAKLRMLEFYYDFVDRYVAIVNNHFIRNRFVTVLHSTSHSSSK